MFVNKPPTYISRTHISKSKRYFDVKSSIYYFHMKTKVLRNFQICISVPLSNRAFFLSEYFYLKNHPKNTYLHSHFHDVREFHHCFSSCFHDYILLLHSSTTFPYSRNLKILISFKRHTFNIKNIYIKVIYSCLPNRRVARNKRGVGKDEPFLINMVPGINMVVKIFKSVTVIKIRTK